MQRKGVDSRKRRNARRGEAWGRGEVDFLRGSGLRAGEGGKDGLPAGRARLALEDWRRAARDSRMGGGIDDFGLPAQKA